MHVVCVCVWNYRRFASLDLTAFWRGGPMQWGRWQASQARSCHGYYLCCMVWGKYRVCRAAFFVKLWMLGFGFDMSERMSEEMSESMSKDMSERMSEDMSQRMSKDMSERCQKEYRKICQKECQKIYQKICQKECQKICQKERQKIASSQSAKLRVTERISGDEMYVYPHLTRSAWHKWMWRENFVIDKMETGWAQSMTFGFGFGVFKRRMLNRGRCITSVMWKWNFVRSCWCCCLRRGGGLDAETKRSSSTNWHHILSWIHSQTASLLELDDNPPLTTSTQHVMVGITRSKVIFVHLYLGKWPAKLPSFLKYFIWQSKWCLLSN